MAWSMMGPMVGANLPQMPEPTFAERLKYGISNFFSPENKNANLGIASALLAQSGWHPTAQAPTLGQALGQAFPAYQQGRQQDKLEADEAQLGELAKQMGLEGVPSSMMPGLVSQMLAQQFKGGTDDMQEYKFAKQSGYAGTFEDWMAQKVRGGGVEPYYSPLVTSTGVMNFDHRTGKAVPITAGGKPVLAPATDPTVRGTVAQAEARGKEVGGYEGGIEKRGKGASEILDMVTEAEALIPKATSSGAGTLVDAGAALFGKSPPGAAEAAQLKVLAGNLRMKQPRMEGPQSNFDSQLYSEMAGQLGDSTLPVEVRLAAAKELRRLNEKYAAFNSGVDMPQQNAPKRVKW